MKIYAIYEDVENYKYNIENLFQYLSEECANKIKRFRKKEDKLRSIISELGIRFIASHIHNIKNEDIIFEKTLYGKPFIKKIEKFHFNISHSGNWVVFAVDEQEVGIDVEKIQSIDLNIANVCLSSLELQILSSKKYEEGIDYFYEVWTLKEAYLKAIGEGLNKAMKDITIKLDNNSPILMSGTFSEKYYLHTYNLHKDYKLAVSSKKNIFAAEIENLKLENIIKYFLENK